MLKTTVQDKQSSTETKPAVSSPSAPSSLRSPDQRAVAEWFARNGGHANLSFALGRVQQEFCELMDAGETGTIEDVREEIADVALSLMMAAEYAGCDMLEMVRWKQSINEQRRWAVNPQNGCIYHIKGSDPRELPIIATTIPPAEHESARRDKT